MILAFYIEKLSAEIIGRIFGFLAGNPVTGLPVFSIIVRTLCDCNFTFLIYDISKTQEMTKAGVSQIMILDSIVGKPKSSPV